MPTLTIAADVTRRRFGGADDTPAHVLGALHTHGVAATWLPDADWPAAKYLDALPAEAAAAFEEVHEVLFSALVDAARAYLVALAHRDLRDGLFPTDQDLAAVALQGLAENLDPNK